MKTVENNTVNKVNAVIQAVDAFLKEYEEQLATEAGSYYVAVNGRPNLENVKRGVKELALWLDKEIATLSQAEHSEATQTKHAEAKQCASAVKEKEAKIDALLGRTPSVH